MSNSDNEWMYLLLLLLQYFLLQAPIFIDFLLQAHKEL